MPASRQWSTSWRLAAVLTMCLLATAACWTSGPVDSTPAPSGDSYYISLGDSYAAGYQPSDSGGSTTTDGFAYQVTDLAAAAGMPVLLANYGCSGVTTTTIVSTKGCKTAALGPGAPGYADRTQAAAALALMAAHPGQVKLVTMVMGGNDLAPCLQQGNGAKAQSCVEQTLPVVRRNIDGLLTAIRAQVGDAVPIVGLTYPDVYLGDYLKTDAASQQTAARSLTLFKSYLNPTLAQVYAAHGAKFVDVTALTGAYGSMKTTQSVSPYGEIPVPVAKICQLTWFCARGDVHPNHAGHAVIAKAVVQAAQP